MKTTMKKVLSMALALVLVLGMLPMGALAAEAGVVAHAHYDNNSSGVCDGCTYDMHACDNGHEFTPNTYSANEAQHWQVCNKCLNWFFSEDHKGGTATCIAKAICEVCGQPYGDLNPAGHTGGTATCGSEAICTRCHKPYGNKNAENHVVEGSTLSHNENQHYRICSCGQYFDYADHTWEAATATTPEVCTICRRTRDGALGTSTINVIVVMGGVSQNGGSFTMTAGSTKTANDILNAFLATSTYAASNISSYYVTANGSQLTGNQTLALAAASTYTLTITPANNVNNNYTNNNPTVISVGFVPNYNTYNYATSVASPVPAGTRVYDIAHNVTRVGHTLEGWYYDSGLTQRVPNDATVTGSITLYAKWTPNAPYPVSVIVYTNGNFNTPVATLDLYSWALDGEITLADLQQAVAGNGIKANNNYGLTVYGPYTPSEWISYKNNNYYKRTTEKIKINTTEPTVLYTMVHNVKITKGVTDPYGAIADKTNPKTGDMIYAPMMVLGLSASALAVLFYLNKKRAF